MSDTFYLSCSSPTNDNNVSCSGSGRIKQYLGVNSQTGNLGLVSTKSTQFTFKYINGDWLISTVINGVTYFVADLFSGLKISRLPPQGATWLLQVAGSNQTVRNITAIDSSVQSVFIAAPGSLSSKGSWILTYTKEIFGGYYDNKEPMVDQIVNGNPITTNSGNVNCNYIWSFEQ